MGERSAQVRDLPSLTPAPTRPQCDDPWVASWALAHPGSERTVWQQGVWAEGPNTSATGRRDVTTTMTPMLVDVGKQIWSTLPHSRVQDGRRLAELGPISGRPPNHTPDRPPDRPTNRPTAGRTARANDGGGGDDPTERDPHHDEDGPAACNAAAPEVAEAPARPGARRSERPYSDGQLRSPSAAFWHHFGPLPLRPPSATALCCNARLTASRAIRLTQLRGSRPGNPWAGDTQGAPPAAARTRRPIFRQPCNKLLTLPNPDATALSTVPRAAALRPSSYNERARPKPRACDLSDGLGRNRPTRTRQVVTTSPSAMHVREVRHPPRMSGNVQHNQHKPEAHKPLPTV